jgi:hypothetical protein
MSKWHGFDEQPAKAGRQQVRSSAFRRGGEIPLEGGTTSKKIAHADMVFVLALLVVGR